MFHSSHAYVKPGVSFTQLSWNNTATGSSSFKVFLTPPFVLIWPIFLHSLTVSPDFHLVILLLATFFLNCVIVVITPFLVKPFFGEDKFLPERSFAI